MAETLTLDRVDLEQFFPKTRGINIVELPASHFDIRPTKAGAKIKCIDRRNGMTEHGYDPETVPEGPAWVGALDGVHPFYKGTLEQRIATAVERTNEQGFDQAHHGDYTQGERGCAFVKALVNQAFPDLKSLTVEERQILRVKFDIHYTELFDASHHAEAFVLNDKIGTMVMPEGGKYYPNDLWFGRAVGINLMRALPVIAKCAELLLPEDSRNIYVVKY